MKYIAFYLPQFHPIPENDKFWGKGFTEWTNVVLGKPRFKGHYQPKLPGELGFYDLRLKTIQEQQVDLAKSYGIYGFCFHFYWFQGKRLLELPIKQFVENENIDFPFCLNWANENWTRRWDGRENEILIKQEHSFDDTVRFIEYVAMNYMMHKNYIRVEGKPVLIIYRPNLFNEPHKHTDLIRDWCFKNGIGEIYLIGTHAIEHYDPRDFGFDAALEFAPNTFPASEITDILVKRRNFKGKVLDYLSNIDLAIKYDNIAPDFEKFRGICPSWDNEARRRGMGTTFFFSLPLYYKAWLSIVSDFTLRKISEKDKRFVFINAWNEWAEGACLEPDKKFGRQYLEATKDVLDFFEKRNNLNKLNILFISHDACFGGAQKVLLSIIKYLTQNLHLNCKVLFLNRGEFLGEFQKYCETYVIEDKHNKTDELLGIIKNMFSGYPDIIYGNTVVSAKIYDKLSKLNIPIVSHIHELESSIQEYAKDHIDNLVKYTNFFIAVSKSVYKNLKRKYGIDKSKVSIINECIDTSQYKNIKKEELRSKLGLPVHKKIVLGVGIGMPFRKGADLFIKVALETREINDDIYFCWVGGFDKNYYNKDFGFWKDYVSLIETMDNIEFTGFTMNVNDYYLASDIMFLSSREDPFPLVMLEAGLNNLPIIAFKGGGGAEEFLDNGTGILVEFENTKNVVNNIIELTNNAEFSNILGKKAKNKVEKFYSEWRIGCQVFSLLFDIIINKK